MAHVMKRSFVAAVFVGSVTFAGARRFGIGAQVWARWEPVHLQSERGGIPITDLSLEHPTQPQSTPEVRTNPPPYTAHFYTEAVKDHAADAASSPEYWRQHFYVDQSFWRGDNYPVFLYIGGESPQGPVSPMLLMSDLAKEHGALMISLEHRFYGVSHPTPNMTTDNLQFLTSEQALEDIARFRVYLSGLSAAAVDTASDPPVALKHNIGGSKWVGFGGSYPGALAAWVKTKYPSLFVGTVASSAPVQPMFDFAQYAQVVGAALRNPQIGGSDVCYGAVAAGADAIVKAVVNGSSLPPALQPCSQMTSDLDRITYYSNLFSNFQGTVQYNLEGRTTVADLCVAVGNGTDPLESFANATALFVNMSAKFSDRCVQSNWTADVIAPLQNTTFDASSIMRQWTWQSCNEFGYFQTTTGVDQPFAPFEVTIKEAGALMCSEIFGLQNYTAPNTLWAMTNYGGRRISATNVTFPNGNMDPWHALSIVNSSDLFYNACTPGEPSCTAQAMASPTDVKVFIANTGHCRDMYAPGAMSFAGINDTEAVVWAHSQISARVAAYLN